MAELISMLAATAGQGGVADVDPNFNQTVLLLHGDGTNGAQNNTFVDSSTNNFTVTRNGNTTQGTFSPFSLPDGRWSNYFDGTGDYLTVADSAEFDLAGDFTIEFWWYPTDLSASSNFFSLGNESSGQNGITIYWSSGSSKVVFYSNASAIITSSISTPANAWYHICVNRSGGGTNNTTLYINGVSAGTATNTTSFTGVAGNGVSIGAAYSGTFAAAKACYISSVRIIDGTAITPPSGGPTAPLTAVSGTSLLTCQSNRFVDNSSNAFAITRNGDVKVTPFSPFAPTAAYDASVNGGSGYFDGTGDYLTVASGDPILPTGTQDYAVECWVYWGTQVTSAPQFVANPTNDGFQIYYDVSGGLLAIGKFNIGNVITYSIAQTALAGQWTHILATRSGNTHRLFVNGVLRANGVDSHSFAALTTQSIGSGGATNYIVGNLAGLRSTLGSIPTGYQTASTTNGTAIFTPPTAPVTTTSQGATSGDVEFLCNFTNAGIFDNTGKNVLETVADAQIDTTTKKYGTGSMEFDGTGDYLTAPTSQDLAFGTGDFTVEFWVYIQSGAEFPYVLDFRSGESQAAVALYFLNYGDGSIDWYVSGASRILGTSAGLDVWQHIAVARQGTSTKLFVNGVQSGSTYTDSTNYVVNSVNVGRRYNNALLFTGFIDDLRITKGVARYTTTFTPPTKEFPNL